MGQKTSKPFVVTSAQNPRYRHSPFNASLLHSLK